MLAAGQINAKTHRFIEENGLARRVRFLADPDSAAIAQLGLAKEDAEPMEAGVPHPATYLLDRDGRVRFADVREDFHFWLDPELLREALTQIP